MGKRQASARRFSLCRAAHVGARRPGPTKARQARASQGGRACRMGGAYRI